MTAFDTAMASLFADVNMATDALFTPQGGEAIAVRVILRAPDLFQKVGNSVIDTPSQTLEVRVSDCPNINEGDQFSVGSSTYLVQGEPKRDELQLTWLVDVYAA